MVYYSYKNSLIYVSALTENSNASKYLKIGDQIVSVDDKNYLSIDLDEWCKITEKGVFDDTKNKITISILRNGDKMTFQLDRKDLLK